MSKFSSMLFFKDLSSLTKHHRWFLDATRGSHTLHPGRTVPHAHSKLCRNPISVKCSWNCRYEAEVMRGVCVRVRAPRLMLCSHTSACVCAVLSPWPVWPGGGVHDKPLSLLSVSSLADFLPQHSHTTWWEGSFLFTNSKTLCLSGGISKSHHASDELRSLWKCSAWSRDKDFLSSCGDALGTWPSCHQWEASGTRRHAEGYEASSKDR